MCDNTKNTAETISDIIQANKEAGLYIKGTTNSFLTVLPLEERD